MIEYTDNNLAFCVNGLKSPKLFNIDTNLCSGCAIKKNNITSLLKNHNQKDFCCYETCNNCDYLGNDKYHNCTSCKTGYSLKIVTNSYTNCYVKCNNLYYLDNNNNLNCLEDSNCPKSYSKLIQKTKQCIKTCSNDENYKYEYENQCYNKCPKGTQESKTKSYLYEIIKISTTELIPIQVKPTQKSKETQKAQEFIPPYTTYSLPHTQLYSSILIFSTLLNKKENETYIEEIFNYIKIEDFIYYFSFIEVNSGKDKLIIDRNNSKFIITSTHNQNRESNKTTINIGNCETKLKDYYNISKEDPLYILKIEVNIEGMKIPKIEYEIYYPLNESNLTKLDLSICQNEKIILSIPVEINDIIDKYNPKSGYYNDICYTFTSEIGTDISLADRKEDFINNNMTLCEENCVFEEYDYINNKSICSCE